MNSTTRIIIDRLPSKPLLSPAEIADAYGLASTNKVLADIKTGILPANRIGGKFLVSHAVAEEYIERNEYSPDEGVIS